MPAALHHSGSVFEQRDHPSSPRMRERQYGERLRDGRGYSGGMGVGEFKGKETESWREKRMEGRGGGRVMAMRG